MWLRRAIYFLEELATAFQYGLWEEILLWCGVARSVGKIRVVYGVSRAQAQQA